MVKSRTPEQRNRFRQALDEGLTLGLAMLAAGYSPKVARQGRAKLCSALLLDLEDWEREQKDFEEVVRNIYWDVLLTELAGCPPSGGRKRLWPFIQAEVAQLDRRERSRRRYARRNAPLIITFGPPR